VLIQELYLILEDYKKPLERACKKIFDSESLNDYMAFKSLINIADLKKIPCECDYDDAKRAIRILEKYMIITENKVKKFKVALSNIVFEEC
jgi:hypothetical protein